MAENVVASTKHIRDFIRENEHQIEFFQLMRVIASHLREVNPADPLDDFERNDWDANFRKKPSINNLVFCFFTFATCAVRSPSLSLILR